MSDARPGLAASAVWQSTLASLRPNFWTLFAVAAPFTLLVRMVLALYGPELPSTMADLTPRSALFLIVVPALVGAIAQLAVAHMVGRPGEPPRAALAAAFAVLPAYLAALLLTALPTGLGFLLLIVPGLYLSARLFPVLPIAAIERLGPAELLRRSWAMTDGAGWSIAWFLVLGTLALLGLSFLGSGIGAALGSVLTLAGLKSVGSFAAALVTSVLGTVFAIASAVAATVIYDKLK